MRRLLFTTIALSLALTAAPALAGTTGSLTGNVVDGSTSQPVADAKVTAKSPSQIATAQTDAHGNFAFVSLQPDTYAISIEKATYEPLVTTGISIFADQSQTLTFRMNKSLKTIATVKARSSLDLVRSGTITDVYSVNPAVTQAAAPIGGGGGLNNAYSAIAAMPGAYVPNGQMGVNQTVYIRGGYYDQIGYEYDGVPVNRSFDNYPGHSASTLGQQELQIYAGGGGAGANATGLAGFINQVVKTGTYPGYATLSGQIGAPTFYHDVSIEAGGSTPDRLFSYYAGISGYDQDFRYLNNANGANLTNEFPYPYGPSNDTTFLPFWPAVYPTCSANATYNNPATKFLWDDPGCFSFFGPNYSEVSYIAGREAVANFHVGIPHRNDAGRDDVQFLYTSSAQYRQFYSGVNDAGPTLVNGLVAQDDIQTPQWPDYYTFPGGTSFLAPANTQPIAYLFPGSPTNRCANVAFLPNSCPYNAAGDITQPSTLPANYRDGRWDTASIVKLQYQKNLGSNAYLRFFGYTFYSNTNRSGATGMGIGSGFAATNYDYEVDSHTRGVQLDFGEQMTSNNLVNATFNYVTSTTSRLQNYDDYNTAGYDEDGDFGGQQISSLTNGSQCFAYYSGALQDGQRVSAGQRAPCNDPITQGFFTIPTGDPYNTNHIPQATNPCAAGQLPSNSPACLDSASWKLTFTGNQGLVNAVQPAFTNVSMTDEWRPNDRLDVSLGLKYSNDNFTLGNTDNPGTNFWFSAAQQEFCYNPVTYQVEIIPEPPQYTKYLTPYATFNCPVDRSSGTPVQTVHPDGKDGHLLLSNSYPPVYNQNYWQPRIGLTDTLNPDTVVRFSAGRYAQEPQNYDIEYQTIEPNLAAQIVGFIPFGFTTPFHNAQAQFSNNYDISYERHFKGTDMSIKITPYYRYATNQLDEDVYVPTLLASPALNAGTEISDGVELQFTKGDFNRNGLAAIFSYTYLNSEEKWNNFQGIPINAVDPYNQYIQEFNALTKAGGGAKCYYNNIGIADSPQTYADPTCKTMNSKRFNPPILNPYYTMPPQALLNRYGWYSTGLDYPYTSPNVFALILNYKHNRFAITPAITLNEGATYGNPADVVGLDPRTCEANQAFDKIPGGVPLAADYTSCKSAATPTGDLYIPNPETGTFDSFGEFRQPWQLNMGLQLSYEISPRMKATLIVANLVNACFGGSAEPWTTQYPPSSTVCGYSPNLVYNSNFYNGSSPHDVAANGVALNPYFEQPFVPSYGDVNSYNYPLPMNFYFQVQVKL